MVAGRLLPAGYAVLAAAVAGYALTFPSAVPSTAVAHALGIFTAAVAGTDAGAATLPQITAPDGWTIETQIGQTVTFPP
jgi:hypothetical protein